MHMGADHDITTHYHHGTLEEAILSALTQSGKNIDALTALDLTPVDEFHLGWLPATTALAEDLGVDEDSYVLDIGSGIGGPARIFAETRGCRVLGIDLTPEYVAVATALTRRCGLDGKVTFQQGSGLTLPFADATFEGAILLHVGMNIADKRHLFAEARRVLKPSGRFGVYDVMRIAEGEISYPTPWAASAETSFVETPQSYHHLLTESGFLLESEQSRRDEALALWHDMREQREKHGPPALGLHILMGPQAPQRLGNVISALEQGVIAPVQILARAG
jgi:SAM-dependent methyltransferase